MKKILTILTGFLWIKTVCAISAKEDILEMKSIGQKAIGIFRSINLNNVINVIIKYWIVILALLLLTIIVKMILSMKEHKEKKRILGTRIEQFFKRTEKGLGVSHFEKIKCFFSKTKKQFKKKIDIEKKQKDLLLKYIHNCFSVGVEKKLIKDKLIKKGWEKHAIDFVFKEYEKVKDKLPNNELIGMFKLDTKKDILKAVETKGRLNIKEITKMFGVSPKKIKEWTDELENEQNITQEEENGELILVSNKLKRQELLSKIMGTSPNVPDKREAEGTSELLLYIQNNERISIKKAAKKFNTNNEAIEDLANYLEEEGKIKRIYSLGRIYLVPKEEVKEFIEDEITNKASKVKGFSPGKLSKETKKLYPKWPDTRDEKLKIERTTARKICEQKEQFCISELLKIIEQAYTKQLNADNKRDILNEIREWVKEDELCVSTKKVKSVQYYQFI